MVYVIEEIVKYCTIYLNPTAVGTVYFPQMLTEYRYFIQTCSIFEVTQRIGTSHISRKMFGLSLLELSILFCIAKSVKLKFMVILAMNFVKIMSSYNMRERRYYVQVSHIMKNCGLICLWQVIAISFWNEISTEYPNFNVTTLADSS